VTHSNLKRCLVAYATPERQHLWTVELAPHASIQDAISAARALATCPDVPWDEAPVGIFGELRARTDIPAHGDRVELYRALPNDPRQQRRERVRQARLAARRAR
jgi:putative ubiquitin-RnfH superfamily antitoxin RatB of RatAB toxin-antitoxin module